MNKYYIYVRPGEIYYFATFDEAQKKQQELIDHYNQWFIPVPIDR